jgi:transposase
MPKQPLEFYSCASEFHPLTRTSPCEVHALEGEDGRVVTRKLPLSEFPAFFADAAPCLIGMEARGSAHYWARELGAMGFEVRLIPPIYVEPRGPPRGPPQGPPRGPPYVERGKNDAVDAAAVREANSWRFWSRPDMRFVPVKSAEQQAALMPRKTREPAGQAADQ